MATKIGVAPSYFTDFAGGQGGGITNYFSYDADHDTNYTVLKSTLNQVIDEISALSGPNAVAALDLVLWDDVDNPISSGEQNEGVVGAASYEVSVEGGGTLEVKKGQAFVVGQRVSIPSTLTGLTSSGGSGTRWVAIDENGAVSIQSLAAQKALDIASVTWNGTIFTGTPTHLADVFFDGDSWAELRDRTAAGTSFPAVTFRRVSERFEALEQSLSAATGGAAFLAMPPGVVGDPGLVFSDGAGGADTTTGWYRAAADVWAFATSAAQRFTLGAYGIRTQDGSIGTPAIAATSDTNTGFRFGAALLGLVVAGADVLVAAAAQLRVVAGVVGTPALAFIGDPTSGWFRPSADQWAFSSGGVERVHLDAQGLGASQNGVVGTPWLHRFSDTNTGLYFPAADEVALTAGGEKAVVGASIARGGVALPNILRCKATNEAGAPPQNLTDATWEAIILDESESFDVGGWHDLVTNPSRFTCPANGGGTYLVVAHAHFSDPGTPSGNRGIRFALNGTLDPSSEILVPSSALIQTALTTTLLLDLVPTDYVEVEAFEDGTGGVISVVGYMSIHRVA
jgi:hypothetical protein